MAFGAISLILVTISIVTYVPDFNLFNSIQMPDVFFRKVEEQWVFVWRDEQIAVNLEEDYNDETILTRGYDEANLSGLRLCSSW